MTGRSSVRKARRSALLSLALAVAGALTLTACGSEGADPAEADPAALGARALLEQVEPDGPGCTIAIGRDGEVVFADARGLAKLETGAAMTPRTVVDIASVSKQFTATAALMLVADGDLELGSMLSDHVGGLPDWAREVTVADLIHHQSGIPDYIDLLIDSGVDLEDAADNGDALDSLATEDVRFVPGSDFEYSNSNYVLLGQVVEAVSGTPLPAFLAQRVFGPLGLDADMDPGEDIAGKAVSYERRGEEWAVEDSGWLQTGDGAIQTTPSELVRWASQYWEPTIGGTGIHDLRFEDARRLDGAGYAAGIIEADDPEVGRVLFHGGGWEGFASEFIVLPDDRLALAMTCTAPRLLPDGERSVEALAAWR